MTITTITDLTAAVRGLRPDVAACGVEITDEDCRQARQETGLRYEEIDEEALDRISTRAVEIATAMLPQRQPGISVRHVPARPRGRFLVPAQPEGWIVTDDGQPWDGARFPTREAAEAQASLLRQLRVDEAAYRARMAEDEGP